MNRIDRHVAATRPAFLTVTALGVALGVAHGDWREAPLPPAWLVATALFGALFAHAGANVLNDVADADNGSDYANDDRVAPFTGGSRLIQLGLLSRDEMQRFGGRLLAAAAGCGACLLLATDARLLLFGAAGLFLALAYSLPPFRLMSRGLGEVAVAAAWLLVVTGSDFLMRGELDGAALGAGLPYALQIALILIVNEVPDRRADQGAGKRNLVVRLGPGRVAALYGATGLASYTAIGAAWAACALPALSLVSLLAAPAGIAATLLIHRHASHPARLLAPIRLTLLQAHLVGGALAVGLFFAAPSKGTP